MLDRNMSTRPWLLVAVAGLAASPALAQSGGGLDLTWSTIDGGGRTGASTGGPLAVAGSIGQPDAGRMSSPNQLQVIGGFWAVTAPMPCYANCDGSTGVPALNVNDFICFQAKFVVGDQYANCDGSTSPPVLNINDFICFQAKFAAGCL
jgi:hypothetical protein